MGGALIALMEETGKISPLFWHSKGIRFVGRSTLVGETLGMSDDIDRDLMPESEVRNKQH